MATLTTSWKSYASAKFDSGPATVTFYLEAKYSSQSIANNTTSVQTRLRSAFTEGSSMAGSGYKFTCSYASTVSGSGVWYFENEVITSGSSTITHNNDGTKSISLSASAYNKYWNFTKNLSATVSLPKIDRYATITSAQDFNDEGNPILNYSNPAGNSVTTLQVCIASPDAQTIYVPYRDISKTGTSYTFPLTTNERNTLRNAIPNSKTLSVKYYIKTVNGGSTFYQNSDNKTMTIVNANPTVTATATELNADVINLLGNNSASTIIQNVSRVRVAATPSAKKGATISKVVATNSGSTQTKTSSYTFDFNITNNSFNLTATDSRNNTGSTPFTRTMLAYQKVKQNSFTVKRLIPTGPDIRIQLESVYYQQTFGSHVNAPTVKYQIGNAIDPQAWITLTAGTDYTIDNTNHKITLDKTLENVVGYRDSTTVYVEVSDLLSSWSNNYKVSKGIPVFEFGDDEVQVNGDLLLADINRQNVINVRDALGGGGGTTDYSLLSNKPQINGHTLTGNMSTTDIGINIPTKTSQLTNDSGFLTTITSSQVTTALGYTPQEEIQFFDITGTLTKSKLVQIFDAIQNGDLFILGVNTPEFSYNYYPMNIQIETNKSSFDYIDENKDLKHMEITYTGSGNPSSTVTTVGIQEEITSSNKLDYSLIANAPVVGNGKTYYGVCNTGSFTAQKEVTINGFILEEGAIVTIKFTYGNDVTNTPILKINNNDSKYIKISNYTFNFKFLGGTVLTMVYDGTDFIVIEPHKATSSNYGLVKIDSSTSSSSNETVATSSAVKSAYDLASGKQDAITSTNKLDYSLIDNTPTIPDELSDLSDDSTHRLVTDTEKSTWSGKQDSLVSGTNIKTINNTSLLGSGNITLGTASAWGDLTGDIDDQTDLKNALDEKLDFYDNSETVLSDIDTLLAPGEYSYTVKNSTNVLPVSVATLGVLALIKVYPSTKDLTNASTAVIRQEIYIRTYAESGYYRYLRKVSGGFVAGDWKKIADEDDISSYHDNTKQDTLVSGTNIKTINGATLLGSGDITIGGGGTSTDVKINGTSITSGGEADIITEGVYNSSTNKIATMSDIPTNVSDLNNDTGFITSSSLPTKTSDLQNDSNFAVTNANNNFSTNQTVNGNFNATGTISAGSYARNTTDTWIPVVGSGGVLDYTQRKFSTSKTHTDYNNNQDFVATLSFLSFWNGAYNSGGSSNLTYAHQGTIQCKPVTLWTNPNVSASFGAQTINISNLSTYAFIDIIFYLYYPGSTQHMGVERHYYDASRNSGQITKPFRYGSTMYIGNRDFTVNSGSIEFKDSRNNNNSTDNNWYKPYKIIGYK